MLALFALVAFLSGLAALKGYRLGDWKGSAALAANSAASLTIGIFA
jgi:hypothetical protein